MTEKNGAVTIRPATALDAVNIAKLLKHTLGADHSSLRVNDHKVVQWVMQILETSFVAVADMSGRVVGSIACRPAQQPWSDDWFMGEAWLCVKLSTYTRNTAGQLLEQAEKFADLKGLPLFFKCEEDDADKHTLMTRRSGYRVLGHSFARMPQGRESRRVPNRTESALVPT